MFIIALIPLAFIINILVWTIIGLAVSTLISALTSYLKDINRLKRELEDLKKYRARLEGIRYSYETKCIFDWNSRRVSELEERAARLIAEGGQRAKLGTILAQNAEKIRAEYTRYKTVQVIAEARKIQALERYLNGSSFWNYLNNQTIASALKRKSVKAAGSIVAAAATIAELWPLITELKTAMELEIEAAKNAKSRCSSNIPSPQTLNVVSETIENI